jgi:hypothetical protein
MEEYAALDSRKHCGFTGREDMGSGRSPADQSEKPLARGRPAFVSRFADGTSERPCAANLPGGERKMAHPLGRKDKGPRTARLSRIPGAG